MRSYIDYKNSGMVMLFSQVFLPLAALFLNACTNEKERAQDYYDSFSEIILPYKDGTENILTEIQSMLQDQLDVAGDFKLSQQDSIKQQHLIAEFETLSAETLDKLRIMEEMPDSELKSAGIHYVEQTSASVLGAYRHIALPLQDPAGRPDNQTIDSLSEIYSDQLVRSNADFASRQLDFLKKFDLLSL